MRFYRSTLTCLIHFKKNFFFLQSVWKKNVSVSNFNNFVNIQYKWFESFNFEVYLIIVDPYLNFEFILCTHIVWIVFILTSSEEWDF